MMVWMGNVGADKNNPEWHLNAGAGTRTFTQAVKFKSPMPHLPAVIVGLTHIDSSSAKDTRVQVEADNVTLEGFNAKFITWAESQITGLGASWIALAF